MSGPPGPVARAMGDGMAAAAHGTGMRRFAAVALVALATTALSGCALLTPSLDQAIQEPSITKVTTPAIEEKGVLTVALDTTDAPQALEGTDGRLAGYAADVSRALAKKLGLKVRFVDSSTVKDVGSKGKGDIYIGASTEEASTSVKILDGYLEDATALFGKVADGSGAAASANGIVSAKVTKDALAGKRVAVQTGSASADAITNSGLSVEQKGYANVNECLKALEAGEVDYAACDATSGAYLARTVKDIEFVGVIGAVDKEGIALRSSNQDLAAAVEDAFNQMSADGTLDAIHAMWYGGLPLQLDGAVVEGISVTEGGSASNDGASEADTDVDAATSGGTASVNASGAGAASGAATGTGASGNGASTAASSATGTATGQSE